MSQVIDHVVASIPHATAHREVARKRAAASGVPLLENLAGALAGAQHSDKLRAERRMIVVAVADSYDSENQQVIAAARAIDLGSSALCTVARASKTPILVVDPIASIIGVMPEAVIQFGDLASADAASEAGVALAMSLGGLDVLVLGTLGAQRDIRANELAIEFMSGVILAAAAREMCIVLDGEFSCRAAARAAELAPHVVHYLVAAHRVAGDVLDRLGIAALLPLGVGTGDGTSAAMLLPLFEQAAALTE